LSCDSIAREQEHDLVRQGHLPGAARPEFGLKTESMSIDMGAGSAAQAHPVPSRDFSFVFDREGENDIR
jgi:hypothetical protein